MLFPLQKTKLPDIKNIPEVKIEKEDTEVQEQIDTIDGGEKILGTNIGDMKKSIPVKS